MSQTDHSLFNYICICTLKLKCDPKLHLKKSLSLEPATCQVMCRRLTLSFTVDVLQEGGGGHAEEGKPLFSEPGVERGLFTRLSKSEGVVLPSLLCAASCPRHY